ncbi:MAG TPA: hypothetical protein VN756_12225, partial [Solirubrobacterales bacterium]|nr:hypothetical protein [Solirubrobacterales bacterium]
LQRRGLTATLFLLQPVARLAGRLWNGLSPWRRRLRPGATWPRPRTVEVWSESWREPQSFVQLLQDSLASRGGYVRSGGPFDRWDLELGAGPLGGVKIRTAVEEHGSGKQLLRARIWPRASARGLSVATILVLLSVYAATNAQPGFAVAIGIGLVILVGLGLEGTGTATNLALTELGRLRRSVSFQEDRRRERRVEAAPSGISIASIEVDEVRS